VCHGTIADDLTGLGTLGCVAIHCTTYTGTDILLFVDDGLALEVEPIDRMDFHFLLLDLGTLGDSARGWRHNALEFASRSTRIVFS
jgi:hypothetical protein